MPVSTFNRYLLGAACDSLPGVFQKSSGNSFAALLLGKTKESIINAEIENRKYICFFFYYYLLGATVAAIFVYVAVPNNSHAI